MADDVQTKPSGQGFIPPTSASGGDVPSEGRTDRSTPAVQPGASAPAGSAIGDQLARIEDKTARIEDKYARSESLLSRMDDRIDGATGRMDELARQSDLAALRSEVRGMGERVKRMPGTGALVLTAIITAVLTVVLMVAVERLKLDTLLPQRTTATQP